MKGGIREILSTNEVLTTLNKKKVDSFNFRVNTKTSTVMQGIKQNLDSFDWYGSLPYYGCCCEQFGPIFKFFQIETL